MKSLGPISASPEQLPIVSSNALGAEIIRGAAGSGKTTTAILRLKSLRAMMSRRRERQGADGALRVLVLTYNSTLKGYVDSLVRGQLEDTDDIEVMTFAMWAKTHTGVRAIDGEDTQSSLQRLARTFQGLDAAYVEDEARYVLGRFLPENLEDYLDAERTGRGRKPRVDRAMRQRLLDEVIRPYVEQLKESEWVDWNGLALAMIDLPSLDYDLIVVDESQDFSANQIRAVVHHLAEDHCATFVTDTMQRIYAGGYTWSEVGVDVQPKRSHRLRQNYRNTRQIAAFASGLLEGLPTDDDGSLPDLEAATTTGTMPQVIVGKYSQQVSWALKYIADHVDLSTETVAFLHRKGGGWFSALRHGLGFAGLDFVELTRNGEWPESDVNIGLSTFHSAKGLEFDHVIVLGLSEEITPFVEEEKSDRVRLERRLLAVAVARARKHVVIGYKAGEETRLVDYFKSGTYETVEL